MTDPDPLVTLSRETLARVCYRAFQPAGSIGLRFEELWDFRQEHWREVGERLRVEVEEAMRAADESTASAAQRAEGW